MSLLKSTTKRLTPLAALLLGVTLGSVFIATPAAQNRTRIASGTSLPAACAVGDLFFKTAATIGLNQCTATNTWTAVGSGSGSVDDTAYDATSWNGDTTTAPSKNAVRDKIEAIVAGGGLGTTDIDTSAEIASIVGDELGTGKLIFSAGTLAIASGKTLTASNTLTLAGTDGSTITLGAGGTVVYTTSIDTSAEVAAILGDELGSGKVIFSAGTLDVASSKTLTVSNTLTFAGTDSSTVLFGGGGTVLYTTNIDDTAYDATTWNGDTTHAPSKNAVRDKIEALIAGGGLGTADIDTSAELRGILGDETGTGAAVFATAPVLAAPQLSFAAKTANYTVTTSDDYLTADASGTSVTITFALPTAASKGGRALTFIRIDTDTDGTVVLDGNSSETIAGSATYTVPIGQAVTIVSNGTNWIVSSGSSAGLTDPAADRIVFWDDSAKTLAFLAASTGLTISGTNITIDSTVATLTGSQTLTNKTLTAPIIATISNTGTITLPTATDTLVGKATTDTLTNKTFDAEGTGNLLTIPVKWMFNTGVCQGATASLGLSSLTSLAPTALCVTGTNVTKGWAQFPDSDGAFELQGEILLPSDWTGALDVGGVWRTAATSGDIKLYATVACTADAETFNDTWVAAGSTTETAKGNTLQLNAWSISGLTTTGCAAGEVLHWRVYRDRTDAADTLTTTFILGPITFTARRAM